MREWHYCREGMEPVEAEIRQLLIISASEGAISEFMTLMCILWIFT